MKKLKIFFAAFIAITTWYVLFVLISGIENPLKWDLIWQIIYVISVLFIFLSMRKTK